MPDRYPGYDVLAKRNTPSWNDASRRAIDQRLALPRDPRFFSAEEWVTLTALCDRIVPQPKDRPPIPVAAMIDDKMVRNETDGYRDHRLPPMRQAWRRGLHAIDTEARARHGAPFHRLDPAAQDALLSQAQQGALQDPAWGDMPCEVFFTHRMAHDIVAAYYGHPIAWNEIGFGGPASPRGYVRLGADKRDSWEAVEAKPGEADKARRKNRHVA
ncbi:MAG: gluconate 2-dehydrogenase subunit 3 family protein [Acetobacteraceae bacterium]